MNLLTRSTAVLAAAFLLLTASSCRQSSTAEPADVSKPKRIAQGQTIKLEDHLVPGKTVIFDFTSEFCPPCRAIAPSLHKLDAEREDIVVVEVDINRPGTKGIDWQSPVARQFNLQSIPHFKVYGPDGKLQVEDSPDDPKARALVAGWFK
jgi:thiol-disulfide isomerase/thioredoxin